MPYPSKTDRETIIATALDHVSRDGLQSLAIRGVAAALKVAPNALYRYFANLAALRSALAEESRRRLLTALQKAAARRREPEIAIRRIAEAYVRFAREQPEIFALTLMPSTDEDGDAHTQLWRFVMAYVVPIYGEKRAAEAAVTLWAFLHGMTVLEAAAVLRHKPAGRSFNFGLQIWLKAASAPAARRTTCVK